MKLSIYFVVAVCLFSAQQTSSRPAASSYQSHEGIEAILNTVFGQVSSIYKQIQLIILQLANTAEAGIRKIEEDFVKVSINISDLVNDYGDTAKRCIKKYWKALEAAKGELKTTIEHCSRRVKLIGNKVTESLQKQQKNIENNSRQFYNAINECLDFGTVKVAECIFYKMGELKEIAKKATTSTDQALRRAVEDTSSLSKEGNECVRKALAKFDSVQKEVSSKIRNCVKASWVDYY